MKKDKYKVWVIESYDKSKWTIWSAHVTRGVAKFNLDRLMEFNYPSGFKFRIRKYTPEK